MHNCTYRPVINTRDSILEVAANTTVGTGPFSADVVSGSTLMSELNTFSISSTAIAFSMLSYSVDHNSHM